MGKNWKYKNSGAAGGLLGLPGTPGGGVLGCPATGQGAGRSSGAAGQGSGRPPAPPTTRRRRPDTLTQATRKGRRPRIILNDYASNFKV